MDSTHADGAAPSFWFVGAFEAKTEIRRLAFSKKVSGRTATTVNFSTRCALCIRGSGLQSRRPIAASTDYPSRDMFSGLGMGVSTGPGATALNRMSSANSRTQDRGSPITVAFEAPHPE